MKNQLIVQSALFKEEFFLVNIKCKKEKRRKLQK